MATNTNEIEIWIARNEAGEYEVGRDDDSAIERLDENGGAIARRMVRLRVTMAAAQIPSFDGSR